jgi:hypothetical protein
MEKKEESKPVIVSPLKVKFYQAFAKKTERWKNFTK